MLALVGSGEYLPAIEPVDRYLFSQLNGEPRVLCLPTAAGTESPERIRYWMDLGVEHFSRLGVQVEALPIIDRAGALDPCWVECIRQANFIYLSGGRPDYLYNTLKDTPTWEAIFSVHLRGGIIAGCSAGAMIMGARIPGFPRWQPAFGLIPKAVIIPHFDELPQVFIKTIRYLIQRNWTIVGIEGNTALVSSNGEISVIGSGSVTIWNINRRSQYKDRQQLSDPDLASIL